MDNKQAEALLASFYQAKASDADIDAAVDVAHLAVNLLENKSGVVMIEFIAAVLVRLATSDVVPTGQKERLISEFSFLASHHATAVVARIEAIQAGVKH